MTFQFVLSYWDLLGLHVRVFPPPLDNLPDDYNCFTSLHLYILSFSRDKILDEVFLLISRDNAQKRVK